MNIIYLDEMTEKICLLENKGILNQKSEIFVFGHCRATEDLCDILLNKGYTVKGILDNNVNKQGVLYRDIPVVLPNAVISYHSNEMLVLIVSRAYAAMVKQLKDMGYKGKIEKVVEYNSFSDYSLSSDVITEKNNRLERGLNKLETIKNKFLDNWLIICPYAALGDVYYAMAYLPHYLNKYSIKQYAVLVVGDACNEIAKMFDANKVEQITQKEMDEIVQAVLYNNEERVLIAHHDRPYTNELIKVLNFKQISFEDLYCSGVFGMNKDAKQYEPKALQEYNNIFDMERGRTVILSPYAKSVAGISDDVWDVIISHYKSLGYKLYTNVVGEERPLLGTEAINLPLSMFQSAVEYAGTFIGIRSGLCDVIKNAKCKKIALYPDCYYSSTEWKVIDFFRLEGWENIVP